MEEKWKIFELLPMRGKESALLEIDMFETPDNEIILNEFVKKSEALIVVKKYAAFDTDYVILPVISK